MKKGLICEGWLRKGICAIIPVYANGGNISKILFYNEPPLLVDYRLCTVLDKIARYYHKEIKYIRQAAKEITHQGKTNPLPITKGLTLIPFKTRKPIGADDGSMAYITKDYIAGIGIHNSRTYIKLKDGQTVAIQESVKTASNRIGAAEFIAKRFREKESIHSPYGEDNNQTTG